MEDLIKIAALLTIVGLGLTRCGGACNSPDESMAALESSGVTDAHLDGLAIFGCGRDDWSSMAFHGKNAAGKDVDGVVCCGAFKGCTVRW
jgi:hypothetical protein